jgi:molecular chaperone DnaK (HSP70)
VLDDLPPGPAGSARVELVITVNVESILSVTARELRSGRAASVTIRPSGGLSQREIIEIITRRQKEQAALGVPPEPGGGAVRVTTRDQVLTRPGDPTDPGDVP